MRHLIFLLSFCASPVFAERWIAVPGGSQERYELDQESVEREGHLAFVVARTAFKTERGTLVNEINLLADCENQFVQTRGGRMYSDFDQKVVRVPDVPEAQVTTEIPGLSPAFNNLYAYLCNG